MLRFSLAFALVMAPLFLSASDSGATVPGITSHAEPRTTKGQGISYLRHCIDSQKWSSLGRAVQKGVQHHAISIKDLEKLSLLYPETPFSFAVVGTKSLLALSEKTGLTLDIAFPIALFAETSFGEEVKKGAHFWKEERFGRELQYDKTTNRLFIHLGTHGVKPVGIGRKKVVTKTILYNRISPEVMARGVSSMNCNHELYAMRKLKNTPHILEAEALMKHKDPKSGKMLTTFVTKLIRPGSLHSVLEDHSWKLSMKERLKIACDIMRGIDGMQEKQFVHRDLGVKNYLVSIEKTQHGHRKVTAFVADLGRTIPVKWATDVPVQGNSNYAAPETIYREKMKGAHYYKSDIFALGCVFWQLYFGKLPEWCSSDTWKNEAISKKDRYQAKVYLINAIRGHYKAKLEKRMKKDHKLTPRQKFLGLILEMTDPVPEKRGETKVLYIKLHTIVYGKAPEVKAEGKPSPQGKVETNETQSHGSHGHSRHEKVHTK